MTLCQKHPKYQGLKKPTTKLTAADGCTCLEAYAKAKAEREVQYVVEAHVSNFLFQGKKESKGIKLETTDTHEILEKVFKQFSPGIGCLLKVYRPVNGELEYVGSVCAEMSSSRSANGNIRMKVSSRYCRMYFNPTVGAADIHKV